MSEVGPEETGQKMWLVEKITSLEKERNEQNNPRKESQD